MNQGLRSGFSRQRDALEAAAELSEQFRDLEPTALVFFASHLHDGVALSGALRTRFPRAEVIGCTTAGEFTDHQFGVGNVSALALTSQTVPRGSAELARFERGVAQGVKNAFDRISARLGAPLRDLDPKRHVGVVLIEGLKMHEEEFNEQLGAQAPSLAFVGGSAGDNVEFNTTRVFCNGEVSEDGAAVLLLEVAVPFVVTKTCSFESTGKVFKATRVNEATRTVYELNGEPASDVYAGAVGRTKAKLDGSVFMSNPMGILIDGEPWIRSPQQLLPDGGLRFYCKVREGADIHLMRATDLLQDTRREIAAAGARLGKKPSGGLLFNCLLRRLELDAKKQHEPFLAMFEGMQAAGFHTYGESLLRHMNQTLTALLFA